LREGGWAAEERFVQPGSKRAPGFDNVDWGGAAKTSLNEWITADALAVLAAAGRA